MTTDLGTLAANKGPTFGLDANTVGPNALKFLQEWLGPGGLMLTGCRFPEEPDQPPTGYQRLTVSGALDQPFPWDADLNNVSAELTLLNPAGPDKPRDCILRIDLPPGYLASKYLSRYKQTAGQLAGAMDLLADPILKDLAHVEPFVLTAIIFCSMDFSSITAEDVADMSQYLAGLLGGSYGEIGKGQGLIYRDKGSPYLQIRQGLGISTNWAVKCELTEIGMVLPLSEEGGGGSQISFAGKVQIGEPALEVSAHYHVSSQELQLVFHDFPTLKQLIDSAKLKVEPPAPLSSLLNIRVEALEVALNLQGGDPLSDVIFTLRMDKPDPKKVLGDLAQKGTGIGLDTLTLQELKVSGALISNSYAAEIAISADQSCQAQFAGKTYGLQDIAIEMTYDDAQGLRFIVGGHFVLSDVRLYISAEHDSDQGWVITGGTADNATLDISKLLKELAVDVALPLPDAKDGSDLELTNIFLSAAPNAGEYSVSAQTAHRWKLVDGLSVQIEQFSVQKTSPGVSAALGVLMQICDVDLRLSAEKAAGADGGWQFEGSTGWGQKIPIGELITDIARKFGISSQDAPAPAAIAELTFQNLHVAFNTETKDFTFAGEADFPVDGTMTAITVTIELRHQNDGSYTQHFSGQLSAAGLQFALIFEAETQGQDKDTGAPGASSQRFVAAYHDSVGYPLPIRDLVAYISPSAARGVPDSLSFTIRDVLLAYLSQTKPGTPGSAAEAKTSKWLFGVDIEGGINLSDVQLPSLPLVSMQPLPPDQTLKLALQVLVASSAFTVADVQTLSKLLQGGPSLPAKEIDGLALAALLRLGQQTMQLSLPLGLGGDSSAVQSANGPAAPSTGPALAASGSPSASAPSSGSNVTTDDGTQWIKIQRSFGPVQFERVGIAFRKDPSRISALLDAALAIGGLTLSLDGLSVSSPIDHFAPQFDLHGLGIDYRNDPLEIGGAFLKQVMKTKTGDDYTAFAGLVTVRTENLALTAIGSYAQFNDAPSLFIYAVANYPLGGPAFFFVTGFAAGFGYNRALTIPGIDAVAGFSLVADAVKEGGPSALPTDQASRQATLSSKLQSLEQYISPSVGDIFVAAGIKFTSFKLLDSFVLLVIKFGPRFEIDLLGLSTLVAPFPEAGSSVPPVAEAHLALKASFVPAEGTLEVRAQLTSNSYILSKDCHLSGGFAFVTWFDPNANAGDFVLTLGGYHPLFNVPAHYPQVPRLALDWRVSDQLQVKADAYFALTASALMAGGHLQATWQSGDLRAWFNAGADFLIAWKPYHYDIRIYVDIGASYTLGVGFLQTKITVDVGADLHLWGPEFAGTATLNLDIISFTVDFGAATSQSMTPIAWDEFKRSFLPKAEQVCTVTVQQGLVRQIKENGTEVRWIVNPKELVLSTNSAVPSNDAHTDTPPVRLKAELAQANLGFGVAPSGIQPDAAGTEPGKRRFISDHQVTISKGGKDVTEKFAFGPILKAAPAALWGNPNLAEDGLLQPPSLHGDRLVENTLSGFEIRPKELLEPAPSKAIPRQALRYSTEPVPDAFNWQESQSSDVMGADAWQAASDDRATAVFKTKAKRAEMLEALGLVNPVIDYGMPVKDGVVLPA